MDQAQKRGGRSPHWNSPFPTEKNTRSQSASGRAVDGNTSVQGHSLKPSYLDLLARFGLSNEDLEKLSQYPDDQLTPENIPFLLQAIRKPKLAPKVPSVPSESILKARFGVSSEDLEKLSQYPDDQLTPENIPFLLQAIRKPKPAFKVSAVPSKSTEKASFGLSIEDLEKLSQYPDDQLTPDNIPFLLQAIRKPKLAPKVPSKSTEKETLSHADGCGTTVQTTVIDYGHKSKYGYNEGPLEGKTSTFVAEESTEGFQTHQPASVPSAPSSLISSPKNPSKELIRQLGSQTSTRNPQAFPPVDPAPKAPSAELRVKATVPPANPPAVQPTPQPAKPPLVPPVINKAATNQRPPPFAPVEVETVCRHNIFELTPRAGPPNLPCQAAGGQNNFRKEAKDPIRSPFGVVKASWLPSFSHTDQLKISKLPSPSEMNDYNAVTPRMFPHVCSLCNEDCKDKMDWMHHQNTILHIENCHWLLQKHPEWTPEAPSSLKRCKDNRQERHQSRQRSVSLSPTCSRRSSSSHARHQSRSPRRKDNRKERHQSRQHSVSLSPPRSRHSSSSHARHRSRSRSPRRRDNRKERRQSSQRSASPSPKRSRRSSSSHARHRTRSRSRSPRRKDGRQERRQSRQRSVSPSPTCSRHSSSSHARHRTPSRSRSPRYRSRSRSSSRSPKRFPSSWRRSRSPRQYLNSSGWFWHSSSKERGSGNSTRSTEGRHATAPCSQKGNDERKRTSSSSVCREKACEDSGWMKKGTPRQKLSADEAGSQEQTHEEREPEGRLHEKPERLALASLTEKSVLQAMAQLQGQGATGRGLSQGGSSAELAAGVSGMSTVSSDLLSMIQRVATQVITAVLDSKEASTTQASTSGRDRNPQNVNTATGKKAKSQSVGSPGPKPRASAGSKATVKRAGGLGPHIDPAKRTKAKGKDKKDTSLSDKAKSKEGAGLCPKEDKAKSQPKAGAFPEEETSLCRTAKNKPMVSPGVQLGTVASGEEENECAVDPGAQRGIASSDKAVNDSGIGLAPHPGTADSGKAENQGVAGVCSQQGTAASSKSDNEGVASHSLSEGAAGEGEAESLHVSDPGPNQGTAASCETESKCLVVPSSQQDIVPNSKAASQGTEQVLVPGNIRPCSVSPGQVSNPRVHICGDSLVVSAQKGSSPCTDSVNSGGAIPSPQPGMSGTCKTENQVGEQKQVAGSAPPCSRSPGQAAKPRIWICGHGVVAAAQERAASTTIGSQLGLDESVILEWYGQEGLKWDELLPFLQNLATQRQPPDVLIIHLGEDDLAGALECGSLTRVKKQFFLLRKSFATVKVLWSEMMPLGTWHGEERVMNRAQVNSTLGKCLKLFGGGIIKHPGRSSEDLELYIDKANLSNAGLDMFLEDIKNGIVAQVLQPSREASGQNNKRINLRPPAPRSAPAANMQKNRGQAAVSSKAENCGVARPSPQPRTSGSCKAKKQDVEQERVDGSVPPCTGTREQVTKPRVWICGDSLVASVQKWALQKSHFGGWDGLQQGVAVEWHGQEGMTWTQLVPFLLNLAAHRQAPDVLLVHLGEKELLCTPWRLLCRTIQIEVFSLKEVFPKVRLIWSEMLPQKIHRAVGFKKVLQDVNLAVGKCFGGAVIKHVETSNRSHALKVHTGGLSPLGLDLFLENIKNGICAHVPQLSGAAGGGFHEGWHVPRLAPLAPPAGLGSVSRETARQGEPAAPFSEEASQIQGYVGGAALSSQPAACVHRREKMQAVRQQFTFGSFHLHLGEDAVNSQPKSSKAKNSGVASPSPHLGASGSCKTEKEDVEQELVDGSVPPCPGEADVSSQPKSSKAENSGVASVSPQPGMSGTCKTENLAMEQKWVVGCVPPCPGSVRPDSKPRVWICGESVVVSAQKRVSSTAAGSHLGLEQSVTVEWHGQDDLKWLQLRPFLQNRVACHQAPDVLIIHLGEKALAGAVKLEFLNNVKAELFLLTKLFPQVRVIWSEIIPQGIWCGEKGYFKRRRMNTEIVKCVKSCGGAMIKHPRISSEDPELYIDEANLSPSGLDIFLEDIKNGILAHVLHSSEAAGGGIKESMHIPPPASPVAGLECLRQEVATEVDETVSSSEEASSMQMNSGEATVSSQPVSNKAENSSVASPSPQPGTSGTCKTKNQDEEQRLVVGSVHPCPGSPGRAAKPHVWICGHGVVVLAQERAASTSKGSQLGLEECIVLEWHGRPGLTWVGFIPLLQDLASYLWAPDVLIIHLGENDLEYTLNIKFLIKTVKRELLLLKELFPNVKVIWSDVMPWGNIPDLATATDKSGALRQMNTAVGQSVRGNGGSVIEHPRISFKDPEWFTDNRTLSDAGLDVFLEDIKSGIRFNVLRSSQAAGSRRSKGMSLSPPASRAALPGLGSVSQEISPQAEEAVSSSEEASSVWTDTGETAVSPQTVSSKAENSGVAGSCKNDEQDLEQEVVDGSVSPCPGEADVNFQPKSSKAENSGVASANSQPRMSRTCKTENLDMEQKWVVGCVPPCPGSPGWAVNPRVWICGGSVVSLARERAASASRGSQLGLEESVILEWHGRPGLTWVGFIPFLQHLASYLWAPDVLIIHLGENDLASTLHIHFLIKTIKRVLQLLRKLFPSFKVIWSDIMPWENALDLARATDENRVLRKVNTAVGQSVSYVGGGVIKHPRISSHNPELFTDKGTLSDAGLDIFLEDIKNGISFSVLRYSQAAGSRLNKGMSLSPPACPSALPGLGSLSQEVSAQAEEVVSSSEEASSMRTDTGEATVSPQPVSSKAENSGVAHPSPEPETGGSCKTDEEDLELEVVDGSVSPCPGEDAVSSQSKSSKAENSRVASVSPQPGMSGTCKTENLAMEQKWVVGCVPPCLGEDAVSSQPVSSKAENTCMASPSPLPGASGSCKTEKEDVEQELVDGSIPPCPGEDADSSQPMRSKAEYSHTYSPNPQPGMSRGCKMEKEDLEQELVDGSVLCHCSGNPKEASKQRVWICGQSVVIAAEKQASSSEAGSQLGLEEGFILEWHGKEDLSWTQLVPTIQNLAAENQAPDVLIVHLGENDLECSRGAELSCTIKKELVLVKELFPQVRILWSNVLLRRRGFGKAGSRTVNRVRTMVNLELGQFISTLGGAVIEHPAILHTDPDFYIDGENLSCRGLDIFLEDVKNGILAHLHS